MEIKCHRGLLGFIINLVKPEGKEVEEEWYIFTPVIKTNSPGETV